MKLKRILKSNNFILLVTFVIFCFFRFYRLPERVHFNWDQERDAQVAKNILSGRLTLLGPRVLGPDKFFLAPYFYYLLAPFYWLSGLHPRAIVYFLVFYNLLFFILAYWILKKIFNERIAILFLLLWSVNREIIGADTIAWNPVVIPALVLGFWGILNRIFNDNEKKLNWFCLGLLFSLGLNFHFQFVFLALFSIVFIFLTSSLRNIFKNLPFFILGAIFSFFPLLIFDLRHDFLNSKLFLRFLLEERAGKNFLSWWPVLENFLSIFLSIRISGWAAIFLLLFFALAAFLIAKKEKDEFSRYFFLALAIFLVIFLGGFAFYGRRPSEYYFNFLMPHFILILAKLLQKGRGGYFLSLILIIFWSFHSINLLKPVSFGLKSKDRVAHYIAQEAKGKKINIAFSVPLGEDTGYRYLLNYYGVCLDDKPGVPLYKIVIPHQREPITTVIDNIGIVLPAEKNEDN